MKSHRIIFILFCLNLFGSGVLAQKNPVPNVASGIEFYKKGDYSSAIRALKTSTKSSNDAEAWSYLGAAYLRNNELKNSQKAFEKSLQIDAKNIQSLTGLAYVFLLKDDDERAGTEVRKALAIDQNNFEAQYISGVLNYREASYNAAYLAAEKAIKIKPDFANAYLLKSEALAQSYGILMGAVNKSPHARSELLKEAGENLEMYLKLAPKAPDADAQRERLAGLKYMGEYYALKEDQPADAAPSANFTPLKILTKPRAEYTETARQRQVSGTIRLSVLFSADGKIGYVIVFRKLDGGLTEQAIKAARGIKFEPEKHDGKPVSVIKTIEYNFKLY